MPQPLYPPAGPQTIGQVLDSGFRIFQVSLVKCLLYGALSTIAGQLPNIYFIATGRPLSPFGGGSALWISLYLVGAIITLVMYAALLLRQHAIASGAPVGSGLVEALRRLPGYLGLVLLSVLVTMLVPLFVGVLLGISGVSPATGNPNYVVIGVGTLVAAIPVIYLAVPLTFAPPSLLLDGKGPWQAIRYVLRLVRGRWWRTTAILTVAVMLVVVFYSVATLIVGLVLPLIGATDLAAITAAGGVVYVVLGSVGLPFFSAVLLASYGELKVRREGLDLEQRVASIA